MMIEPSGDLPESIDLCHELIRELCESLAKQARLNKQLQHRLEQLLRARFGRRSEKIDPNQIMLFAAEILEENAAEEKKEAEETPGEETEAKKEKAEPAKRNGHGRRPLPKDLPRYRIEYDVPESEKTCPCCGEQRVCIGEETSEQLEWIPASVLILEHARKKYACKNCEAHVTVAEKPSQPIEKGLPGPGLLAQVITNKYSDHLPLNRQEDILARHGIDIPRSTQCGWMAASAGVLERLYDLMRRSALESKVVHTDDTPMPVQDETRNTTRQGHIWVYLGDKDHPYTVYDYTPNHCRDGPKRFLNGYKGYLQADAFPGYNDLYASGDIVEVGCWAHARRRFFEAQSSDANRSMTALAHIRLLYKVEKTAKDLSREARHALRQERSRVHLASFKIWLEKQKDVVLPKSPMGEAIGYALSNWEALERYTEDPDLQIDNNFAERALRPVVLGRTNFLFVGSDSGGRTAAILYTFTQTCRRLGIDPFLYLRDVLSRIQDHPMSRLEELLPDRWKPTDSTAIPIPSTNSSANA